MTIKEQKLFSIANARKTIPYVRSIANDIINEWANIINKRTQMEEMNKAKIDTTNIKDELNLSIEHINSYIKEIEQLGCYVQEFARGIIVWPSLRNGTKIFLCWSPEDPDISFWHNLDEIYKDRQKFSGMMLE